VSGRHRLHVSGFGIRFGPSANDIRAAVNQDRNRFHFDHLPEFL
jgi:hypothetical protein